MASTSIAFDIIARDLASSNLHQVGRAADRTSGPLGGMSSKLKGLAAAAGVAAGAAVVFAAKWGVGAVKAAMADEQAQVQLATQIRNNTKARQEDIDGIEDWISTVGLATGVTDGDLRPAISRLVSVTKDLGKAQDLTRLAMDVSAGSGKSLQSVTEALMKAQNGSITGLSRLGVATKDAAGETMSLDEITKNLADTYGGAAATKADTFAGKMARLKLRYDETKEAIGARLLPILDKLGTWLLDEGIPALESAGATVREDFVPPMEDLAASFRQAKTDAQPFVDLLDELGGGGEGSWKVFITLDDSMRLFGASVRWAGRQLGLLGSMARFAWNEGLQPMFKLAAQGVAVFLDGLADMFKALGSIPGAPKWIDRTAEGLHVASQQAERLADEIRDIPSRKDITIAYHYVGSQQGGMGSGEVPLGSGAGRPRPAPSDKQGRTVAPSDRAMSGGGADVSSIAQALRQVLDGARLQIVPGTSDQYYLLTGSGL